MKLKIFAPQLLIVLLCGPLVAGCASSSLALSSDSSTVRLREYTTKNDDPNLSLNVCEKMDCEDQEPNLSGITWWPQGGGKETEDVLVIVGNNPPSIGVLDMNGTVKDSRLIGADSELCKEAKDNGQTQDCIYDPEGIAYIKGNLFAIVEEHYRNRLTLIELTYESAGNIKAVSVVKSVKLKGGTLTWSNRLYNPVKR